MIASEVQDESKMPYLKSYQIENGVTINVTAADFQCIMARVVENMKRALPYAANDNQRQMVENYIQHFTFGDIDMHKASQKNWISDVGPIIETNIGFIETY